MLKLELLSAVYLRLPVAVTPLRIMLRLSDEVHAAAWEPGLPGSLPIFHSGHEQ